MDWQKVILQNDKIYYYKYREFWGILTINNQFSDNSIQTNINFTFIVYEYIVLYIISYPIWYICIHKYIYIRIRKFVKHFVLFVFVKLLQHVHNTMVTLVSYSHNLLPAATNWSLLLVKAAYPTANMFHVINRGNNSNLVKTFLALQSEVLTGFKRTLLHLTGKLLL